MFALTDARRLAYANQLRRANGGPLAQKLNDMRADAIEASIGKTTTKNTRNQRKIRKARRVSYANGHRFAFAA